MHHLCGHKSPPLSERQAVHRLCLPQHRLFYLRSHPRLDVDCWLRLGALVALVLRKQVEAAHTPAAPSADGIERNTVENPEA